MTIKSKVLTFFTLAVLSITASPENRQLEDYEFYMDLLVKNVEKKTSHSPFCHLDHRQ